MPLLFAFCYRRGLYLTIVILASVFLALSLIFGTLAYFILFSFEKAMPGAGISSFSLPFILAFFMTAVVEIFAIVHAGRKLSKKCFVLAGTEWGLTVRGAFLKEHSFAWNQLESVFYRPAWGRTSDGQASFRLGVRYYRRDYLYVKPYHGKSVRVDVTFLDGRIEDVFACLSRCKPDLSIVKNYQ